MMYFFALLLVVLIGFLIIRILSKGNLSFYLNVLLGVTVGLGIVSQSIFYLQLLGANFNHFLPPIMALCVVGGLLWHHHSLKLPPIIIPRNLSLLILPLLAIPLWLEANYYPLGGWDAWSCWNLKAKFIFLGETHWKDMFSEVLWRSNTGYPLALPTINVWFWHWTGLSQNVPMFNTILLTLLTAGILLIGLQELKASVLSSILITLCIFSLPLGNTLSISQYSDMLFSLYLLSAIVCYLLYQNTKANSMLIVSALLIGLLSFTKNEGLAASAVLTLLILIQKPSKPLSFLIPLVLASLPTLIFVLSMSPHGQAFVNGLLSHDKPCTIERLRYILTFPFFELTGKQWGYLWILVMVGLGLGWKMAIQKPLAIIGLFLISFLTIIFAYYQINTFFEIGWWMQNTLNRILFALMPLVFLWMGLSLFQTKKDA